MSTKLWRLNPRAQSVSLTEQFTHDASGSDARNEVAPDLFFGDETPNTSGAFSAEIALTCNFSSEALVGPPPGIVPKVWFRRDDVLRIVLAEMNFQDQTGTGASASPVTSTLYFSDYPYFDDENSRTYSERIRAVPRYNRAIDRKTLRGRFTSSIGSLELDNDDGALDYLLDKACEGSEIKFYIGDAGDVAQGRLPWLRSQFLFVFSAYVVDVSAPSWNRISIALKDSSILLNKTVGGGFTVGGSGIDASRYRPYVFGYCRQIEAILRDGSTLEYAVSEPIDTANFVMQIPEVRDKGVPVGFTSDLTSGNINLLAPPAGTVTADVIVRRNVTGVVLPFISPGTPYATRVSDAFYALVGMGAGLIAAGKYAGASANFEQQWTNDYHLRYAATEPTDLVDVLDQICDSGNCYYAVTRSGLFTFGWLRPEALQWFLDGNFPSLSSTTSIVADDVLGQIRITHGDPGPYEVQAYGNAFEIEQSDFATGLSAVALAHYRRKGYSPPTFYGATPGATAYLGPDTVLGDHRGLFLGGAPEKYHLTMTRELGKRTLLSCATDADVAGELSAFESVRRAQHLPHTEFIDLEVDLSFFEVELGNVVTLDLGRFGLNSVPAEVVSVDIQLTEKRIALGLVWRRPAFTEEYV